ECAGAPRAEPAPASHAAGGAKRPSRFATGPGFEGSSEMAPRPAMQTPPIAISATISERRDRRRSRSSAIVPPRGGSDGKGGKGEAPKFVERYAQQRCAQVRAEPEGRVV